MPGRVGTAALSGQQARAFRIDAGVHCALSPQDSERSVRDPLRVFCMTVRGRLTAMFPPDPVAQRRPCGWFQVPGPCLCPAQAGVAACAPQRLPGAAITQRCPAGPRVCTARVTVYVCAWTLDGVRGGGSQGPVLGPGPPRGTSAPCCPSRLQS